MIDDDFKRILEERAYSCDLGELDVLLGKYGHDDDYLAMIKRGIYDRLNREDSGDWTSPASSGWKPANDKKKRLEQFILDRGPKGMFNTAAAPLSANPAPDHSETVAQLQKQIRDMDARLRTLEQREAARKFKL